ncbi:hypothetical protein OAS39_07175 [Pirellulales bacterium]|nr:hypothetical protein [Pirellulales bacterium]
MRFRLYHLLVLVGFVALYAAIPTWISDGGLRPVVFLVVSLAALLAFGPFRNRGVIVGAIVGAILGVLVFCYANVSDEFHPRDRGFYLFIFSGLLAAVGSLLGIRFSRSNASAKLDASEGNRE